MSIKNWNKEPKVKCDQYNCNNEGYKVMEIAMRPPTFCKDHYIKYIEDRLESSDEWLSRETRVDDVNEEIFKFLHRYDISINNCGFNTTQDIKEVVNELKKITEYQC
ncbi:hypothetical protein [Niallia taxi]|uniref:hypothetical protein n=1 Tax=Niallia taxi TaxID=2499688 RepID=UPI00300B3E84